MLAFLKKKSTAELCCAFLFGNYLYSFLGLHTATDADNLSAYI